MPRRFSSGKSEHSDGQVWIRKDRETFFLSLAKHNNVLFLLLKYLSGTGIYLNADLHSPIVSE
jgi:hypothetical protein